MSRRPGSHYQAYDGDNLRAIVRLVRSDDVPVSPSEETLASLSSKHSSCSQMDPSLADNVQCMPLSVDQNDARKAVLSFPAGSSGGPDGLQPQYLKDLL